MFRMLCSINGHMLKNKLLFWGLFMTPLFSSSLTLVNDSAFPLAAEIFNAAGDHLATIRLTQNQTYIWNDNQSPFIKQNDSTITPFTITFVCSNGGGWRWWRENALIRNSQGNKGRSQKQLPGLNVLNGNKVRKQWLFRRQMKVYKINMIKM